MSPIASLPPPARALAAVGAALALAGAGIVMTLVIALAGLGRLSADIEPSRLPAWLWYYRHDPELRRWLGAGAAMTLCTGSVLALAVLLSRQRPLHGAARWANGAEMNDLRAETGIILGRARDGRFLVSDGPGHVMLAAPTRTGKGVGIVIPNLMAWPGSVVVLDIKRENHAATAGYRASRGQRVLLFDPLAPDGRTVRFNPLGHIDRTQPHHVIDELQRIAAMLFTGHDHSDPFWSEAARTGFIGVGAYIAATPSLPLTLGEVLRQVTRPEARSRFPELVRERAQGADPLPGPCISALLDFCGASENTFASVRQSITSRLGLWLNPMVDAATSASDLDLGTVREGRMSLYLGASPDNLHRVAPLYALVFQQLVDLNSRRLPGPDDRPVLVLLDEFARLGPAPVLAHAFSWVAGYGLRLLPVIQSPSQLRALYGPDMTDGILSNCAIEIIFAPNELKVAQDVSARLGDYTYRARSRSRPIGLSQGRRSLSESDQRRPLLLPQELLQLPDHACIVLRNGRPPVLGRKIRWYRERVFRSRLLPPPILPPVVAPVMPGPVEDDPGLAFDAVAQRFTDEGLPPPAPGSGLEAATGWLERVLAAAPAREAG